MRQKSVPEKEPATQVVKNIRRATRRHFSAEDKIRIVLEGLRGESRRLLYLERSCGVCDRAQCNAVSTGGMPAATEPWVIQVCGPFPISTTHDAQSSDWANVDPCGAAAGSRRWKSFRASTPAAFERGPSVRVRDGLAGWA
jgi:hypothetical protein